MDESHPFQEVVLESVREIGRRVTRRQRVTRPARGPNSPGEMAPKNVFLHQVFWSFLYDFDLLNPNQLSASRKSLSNFVQTQKTKMAQSQLRTLAVTKILDGVLVCISLCASVSS